MITITLIGTSYRRTPVEIREKLALDSAQLDYLAGLRRDRLAGAELFALSTCNRSECYLVHEEGSPAPAILTGYFLQRSGGALIPSEHLVTAQAAEAVQHLYEVASGLDSMVMGEPQILGQVKSSLETSRQLKMTGPVLDRLLQSAIKTGKRARDETEIGFGAVSVSFAAVELARKVFGDLDRRTAALIGVGEMGTLCARHLKNAGVKTLYFLNRTPEKSESLAREMNGVPLPFEELYSAIARSDIVISSTSAPSCIISAQALGQTLAVRRSELLMVDIAIPRDIEPQAAGLPGIFLYDIDDLQGIVDLNLQKRQAEAAKVQEIIRQEKDAFFHWLLTLDLKPTIVALRGKFEQIRQTALNQLGHLPPAERDLAERLSRAYMNKLLHLPVTNLKNAPGEEEKLRWSHTLNCLFDLEPERMQDHEHDPA